MLVYCEPRSEWWTSSTSAPRAALAERHPQRVEDEVGAHVAGELPADDLAAVGVEHEREEDEPFPAAQVGEVGDPEPVRARRR